MTRFCIQDEVDGRLFFTNVNTSTTISAATAFFIVLAISAAIATLLGFLYLTAFSLTTNSAARRKIFFAITFWGGIVPPFFKRRTGLIKQRVCLFMNSPVQAKKTRLSKKVYLLYVDVLKNDAVISTLAHSQRPQKGSFSAPPVTNAGGRGRG